YRLRPRNACRTSVAQAISKPKRGVEQVRPSLNDDVADLRHHISLTRHGFFQHPRLAHDSRAESATKPYIRDGLHVQKYDNCVKKSSGAGKYQQAAPCKQRGIQKTHQFGGETSHFISAEK